MKPKAPKLAPIKKRKHKSWRERKARLVAKKLKEEEVKCQENDGETKETTSTNNSKHEKGLILADKIFEPLETLLMAYKSQSKSKEPLNIQWDNYLDPEIEKRRFAI